MSRQPPAIGRCEPIDQAQAAATVPDLSGRNAGHRNWKQHRLSMRGMRHGHSGCPRRPSWRCKTV